MGEEQGPVVDLTNPLCPLLEVPLLRRPRPGSLGDCVEAPDQGRRGSHLQK